VSDLVRIKLMLVREDGNVVPRRIRTPEDVSQYANELRSQPHEQFAVIPLTSKNYAIGLHIASMGTLDAALISPANVFKAALLANAAACILAHNHPSGDATVSAEDIRVTKQIIEAGRIMSISVLDHVVLGATDKFTSLRESGLADFRAT